MYSIYKVHNIINTDEDGALSFAGTVFKACYIIATALAGCT